ncbi:MAG: winged helix-turn-helix domain-containing protein [Alphaproteobacteria bacterium]|nr:winged helix-turn-helix domain-containing protein [Alphaproteobacteria bacterium]
MRRTWPVDRGEVDLDRQEVRRGDAVVALTPQEVALFEALVAAQGRTVDRDTLLVRVWGFPKAVRTRAVDHAMSRLRAKVEDDPTAPRCLVGVRGVGYRYEPPAEDDVLVGRRADRAALEAACATASRVTLVGPAGVGKTALASAWAADVGALVVPLEPVEGEGVVDAVAHAARVPAGLGPDASARVGRALAARGVAAVVLDAAEHVEDAVRTLLDTWADAAPTLRVVVTSHGPLDVAGERVVTLQPLPPQDGATLLARALADVGVASVPPTAVLASWSAHLDGLPLALTLLAGRARVVGVDDLGELARHPDALRSDGKDASAEAAATRTWASLPPALRGVLSAACLFGAPPAPSVLARLVDAPAATVQAHLDALAQRAIWRSPHGALAAVRAVARRAAGDTLVHAQARHVATHPATVDDRIAAARRVSEADPDLAWTLLALATRTMLREGPLRPSLADALVAWAAADPSRGPRSAEAHLLRGAVRTLTGDVAGAEADLSTACGSPDVRAEALARRGWLAALQGDVAAAEGHLAAALDGARATGRLEVEAMTCVRWGSVRHFAGDPAGALGHLQAAVGLYEALDEPVEARRARSSAGLMWLELGDPARAEADLVAALDGDRAAGILGAVPQHLLNLGGVALDAGDVATALDRLRQAERLAREVGDVAVEGQATLSRGLAELLDGQPAAALATLAAARARLAQADRPVLVALAWAWTAVACWRRDAPAAARDALARSREVPVPGVVRDAVDVVATAIDAGMTAVPADAPSLVRIAARVVG